MDNLEEIIRTHISLGSETPSGWHPVRCLVCNDHANKKRGGFKFEGNKVSYHCFNCTAKAIYNPSSGPLSKAMQNILNSFSISGEEISRVLLHNMGQPKDKSIPQKKIDSTYFPKELQLPTFFRRLTFDANDAFAVKAEQHLNEKRRMSLSDYTFYAAKYDGSLDSKTWLERLIIPFYHQGKLIFYQGKDLSNIPDKIKYKSASVGKNNIMYGFDEIDRRVDNPLYIVEGFFDAYHINGVAVLGNDLSEDQIKILNKSPRPKVIIPDRKGDGHILALKGLKQNWQVSIPEVGDDCKDVCDAVVKYGKIYVMHSIIENTFSGIQAEVATRIFCEKTNKSKYGNSKNEL